MSSATSLESQSTQVADSISRLRVPLVDSVSAAKGILIWSAGGAAGKSTLALNLAVALRSTGESVALIDADTQSPTLDLMLGLRERTAGLLAVARLARQERYTDTEHARLVSNIGSGKRQIQFVAGLASVARWAELESLGIQAASDQIERRSSYQIWDVASPLDPSLVEPEFATSRNLVSRFLVRHCATVVAVTAPDPVAIARLISDFAELRELCEGRILIVVNRFRTSVLGGNAKRQIIDVLREQLGDYEILFVPEDQSLNDAAIAKATSAIDLRPRSSFARAVAGLASAIQKERGP